MRNGPGSIILSTAAQVNARHLQVHLLHALSRATKAERAAILDAAETVAKGSRNAALALAARSVLGVVA